MATQRPKTIEAYIAAAPRAAQPHLRELHALLRSVAPKATRTIKWGMPFFVEPRFLFAFRAFKSHVSFAPMAKVMERFEKELEGHDTTKNMLKVRYDEPLPKALIRKIAKYCVKHVGEKDSDAFW